MYKFIFILFASLAALQFFFDSFAETAASPLGWLLMLSAVVSAMVMGRHVLGNYFIITCAIAAPPLALVFYTVYHAI